MTFTTRREVLILALAGAFAETADAGAEAWKDKKPSEWSDKDIEKLLTRSPWAKEATVTFNMAGMSGGGPGGMRGGGPPGGGMGGPPGGGGIGPPPGGGEGGMDGPPGGGGMPQFHALVRWDSAAPIRAARKMESAPDNNYRISVSGLPTAPRRGGNGDRSSELLNGLAALTDLERKGKDSIPCSRVEMSKGEDTNTLMFYFESGSAPIQAGDKEITFNTKIGPLQVKAKFVPKEMMFNGKLAL